MVEEEEEERETWEYKTATLATAAVCLRFGFLFNGNTQHANDFFEMDVRRFFLSLAWYRVEVAYEVGVKAAFIIITHSNTVC